MATISCCQTQRGEACEWTEAEVEAQLSPKKRMVSTAPPTGGIGGSDGTHSPDINIHPWDSTVNLSVHQPLYPPGRILHIVRHYPKTQIVDRR